MDSDQTTTTILGGRYELVRRVGRGSSGDVWLARDRELGREVAIKRATVPVHLPERERHRIRKRLEREARAAARLHGSGVVPLYDVHLDEDTVDLVMAFIDAPTLRELVKEDGPLADDVAARIGATVLEVLEAAHAQGVIHRDVKPSNILVADDGVRVTDFGIAAMADETELTTTGTALGSPSYIPPEQAEGREPAPAADLWGLGATLYFALTGRPPFARDRALTTLHAVISQPHDPIDPVAHPLAPLIDDLLAKDPDARPSADEVRRRLAAVASSSGSNATQELPVMAAPPIDEAGDAPALGASAAVADGPSEEAPTADGGGRGRRVLAVLATLAVGGAGVLVAANISEPSPTEPDLPSATEGPSATAPVDEMLTDEGDPASAKDEEASGADGAEAVEREPAGRVAGDGGEDTTVDERVGAVPEGWSVHEGATYRVAAPAGWEVRDDSGNRTDLVDPETGAYLRIDWTDDPASDPEADWEDKARGFAQRYPSYEEVRIEPVAYRDYRAAMWEYRYATSGSRFHAYNLGFIAEGHGYALNFQAPAGDWDEMVELFEGFRRSFEPTA